MGGVLLKSVRMKGDEGKRLSDMLRFCPRELEKPGV